MKFVSFQNNTRDGRLAIVSRGLTRVVIAQGIATTLQELLEGWDALAPKARDLAAALEDGRAAGAVALAACLAMA